MASTNKKYVTYLERSGLANRLRLHCLAQAYALKTGRTLVVDWKPNRHCHATYDDLFLAGPPSLDSLPPAERKTIRLARIFNSHSYGRGTLPNNLGVDALNDSPKRLVILKPDLEASVENGSRLGRYHKAVIDGLNPKPEINSAIARFLENIPSMRVGLHVRMGDFVKKYGSSLPPISRYIDIVSAILVKRPDANIVLVSDAEEEELRPLLAAVKCHTRDKINIRTSTEGIRDALVDMMVLAQTDLVISTPSSSFSAVAAMLGSKPLLRADENWESKLPAILNAIP